MSAQLPNAPAAKPASYFLDNLLTFGRLLRWLGLNVSTEQVSDLARILAGIDITRREDVYYAARSLFVAKREDQQVFDRAFALFFDIRGKPQRPVIDPAQAPIRHAFHPKNVQQMAERAERGGETKAGEPEDHPTGPKPAMVYSPFETLHHKDFSLFTPEEIAAARQVIAEMEWRVGEQSSRRKQPARRGREIDFAHLVRSNLKYGGELFWLPERERKCKPRPLVILADISGSMERYTRMLLHLLHVLAHTIARVEVFVFATQLTRITPDLKKQSVDQALARVGEHVTDWSGGTRIGGAIKTFNFKWARRVLRHGAVVLVLSDGWDTGNLELLRDEMARLQRSCSRLIWLSPRARVPPGSSSTQAIAQGLEIALSFVDDYLPVNDLDSLAELAAKLSTLGDAPPLRRQRPQPALPIPSAAAPHPFADLPQMGTSDYHRRTMVLRLVNGQPTFTYEENPGDS